MAAKLKVYATRIGFHDVVVAAPNQKAALAAWDVRENLFAQGVAAPTDDPDAVGPAQAQPGVVLSRAIGATGPYAAEAQTPASAPTVAKPKGAKAKTARPEPAKPEKPKPPPDRSALTAAERALDDLDAEARRMREAFDKERRALEARQAGEERALATRRRTLERDRERAQKDYDRELAR